MRVVLALVPLLVLGEPSGYADDAAPEPTETTRPPQTTVTLEPFSLLVISTLSVQVERALTPKIGLAVNAGVGLTTNVLIGDRVHTYSMGPTFDALEEVRYGRIHTGVQAMYYADDFEGVHAAAELMYVHHGWASPDRRSIDSVGASALAGWKWILDSGLTFVAQAGLCVVVTHGEDLMSSGLRLDREGTLGPVHLSANAAAGWSF